MPLIESGSANLAPKVTNVNPTTSLFAPASGGGGGGNTPNPQVSTLTVAPNGSVIFDTGAQVQFGATLAFNSTQDSSYFEINHPANGALGIELQTPDGNHGVSLAVDGSAFYIDTLYNNDPIVIGRSVNTTISSLTVSSINGATPGGGGGSIPPTIQVSTIQFGDAGGGLSALEISNTHNITIQDSVTGALNDIEFNTNAGTAPNQYNNMVIYAPYAAQTVEVRASDTGVNSIAATSSISIQAQEQIILQGGGVSVQAPSGVTINAASGMLVNALTVIPQLGVSSFTVSTINSGSVGTLAVGGNMTVFNQLTCSAVSTNSIAQVSGTGVNISSLLVSSINNAPYPPTAGAYPQVSTITQAGGGSQVQFHTSTNAVVQLGSALSTVIGHNYQITFPYGMSPGSSPNYQDVLTFSYQPDGVGATPLLYTQPILPNGFSRIPFTYKARLGTGGVAFSVEANTSYPVLITLDNLEGTTLVDLGPSA